MKWLITNFDGSESGTFQLMDGDLLIHFRTPLFNASKPEILDLWQMTDLRQLRFTNKELEMPPGFELQPDEVCGALAYRIAEKIKNGWQPSETSCAPNIWRMRAGDRLVLIGERPWVEGGIVNSLFNFTESALAYWTRMEGEMPSMDELLSAVPTQGDKMRVEWAQRAFSKVASMGLPREMAEEWRIG